MPCREHCAPRATAIRSMTGCLVVSPSSHKLSRGKSYEAANSCFGSSAEPFRDGPDRLASGTTYSLRTKHQTSISMAVAQLQRAILTSQSALRRIREPGVHERAVLVTSIESTYARVLEREITASPRRDMVFLLRIPSMKERLSTGDTA